MTRSTGAAASDPRDDRSLLDAWRAGDPAAGNALFERHFDSVYRFLRNKAGTAAEDLVQQTFLATVAAAGSFRAESSVRTYLFTVARSKLYDHLRRLRREEPIDFANVSLADLGTSPSRAVARRMEAALAGEALRRLPLELQVIVELFYFEEMSSAEVAQVVGIPEGTVKSRVRRALEQLRALVASLGAPADLAARTLGDLDAIAAERDDGLG